MRMPFSVSGTARLALLLLVVVGAVGLISAARRSAEPTVHDKIYYADANLVNFVRPGLVAKILSANIAADGTITARVRITDPKGMALDREGIVTPGAVSLSLIAATIKNGETQYTSYTTRSASSSISNLTVTQAAADSGGSFQKAADGEYIYTFKTKAPAGFDAAATHSIGVYGSRNLSEFDMGTQYTSDVFTFVPNGSQVTTVRDVIRTASCNNCHDQLSFHGGSRRGIEMCNLCHTPQTSDPDTGNTVDMPVMIHKIHAGSKTYKIIGHGGATSDWSTVTDPADVRRCEVCHEQNTGAAQATAFLKPTQTACGSCHEDVNFTTGENHGNMPQASNNLCGTCHQPQGELDFDLSVKGAHVVPAESVQIPGVVVELLKVDNGTAGNSPTVTFTLRDNQGNGIPLSSMTASPNRVYLVMAGPTVDYGYTSFGASTPGYVSENAAADGSCSADGLCSYTFKAKIPANATGTYTIGIEARRGIALSPGTVKQMTSQYGAVNKVINFSVDGSQVTPRRTVVAIEKCNACHSSLSLHGENRNQIEQCVLCHNASETDKSYRASAKNAEDKALPPQAVDFALMIHKIHTGENMAENGRTYVVVGYGGSHNDFTEVRYPAFSPSGSPGDRRNCSMCHVNNSEQLPLQAGLNQVTDPQGLINPVGPITAACTACHSSTAAASHALNNTSTQLGEACDVCHGQTSQFSINKVHAR